MQKIGDEERMQADEEENKDNLNSFLPEPMPEHVTQCLKTRNNKSHYEELDAQRFLPCHYFDLICGSSTGR